MHSGKLFLSVLGTKMQIFSARSEYINPDTLYDCVPPTTPLLAERMHTRLSLYIYIYISSVFLN